MKELIKVFKKKQDKLFTIKVCPKKHGGWNL